MKESNVRGCSLIKMMSNQNEYTTSLTNAMYPSKYCFISVETGMGDRLFCHISIGPDDSNCSSTCRYNYFAYIKRQRVVS